MQPQSKTNEEVDKQTNTCFKFESLSPVLETDFYTLTWTPASQTRKCINKWEKFVETESEFSFSFKLSRYSR